MSQFDGVNPSPEHWIDLFATYRIATTPGEEVIQGRLHPHLSTDHSSVTGFLDSWEGRWYLTEVEGEGELVLLRPVGEAAPTRWRIHLLLFCLTLFTTMTSGALLTGVDPLYTRFLTFTGSWIPYPTGLDVEGLLVGSSFALCLLGVLLGHELGHFLAARYHGVRATLPFFIPFPSYFSIVGTLGAFIRIKSPLVRRSILLDVGVGGPAVSFLLSIPLLVVGFNLSETVVAPPGSGMPYVVLFAGEPIWIGGGILVKWLAALVLGEAAGTGAVVLHPVAFAGWIGLFVTALNLLPLGQLDGGHILYALAGRLQGGIGTAFLFALVPLGFLWWGWWLWGVIAVLVARRRVRHPPLLQESVPLGVWRKAVAWLAVFVFFLTFVPVPLSL